MVKPAHLQAHQVDLQVDVSGGRTIAKVHITDGIYKSAMRPWTDQQLALPRFRSAAMIAHEIEIVDGIL